jgi:hypothetical protein
MAPKLSHHGVLVTALAAAPGRSSTSGTGSEPGHARSAPSGSGWRHRGRRQEGEEVRAGRRSVAVAFHAGEAFFFGDPSSGDARGEGAGGRGGGSARWEPPESPPGDDTGAVSDGNAYCKYNIYQESVQI